MSFYVQVDNINGRNNFYKFIAAIESRGFTDVLYHNEGWSDTEMNSVAAHLKFEKEEDAIVYSLMFGGNCSRTIPLKINNVRVG